MNSSCAKSLPCAPAVTGIATFAGRATRGSNALRVVRPGAAGTRRLSIRPMKSTELSNLWSATGEPPERTPSGRLTGHVVEVRR